MSTSVTQLVDRKLALSEVGDTVNRMPQSSEDFFTRDDRKELYRQTIQGEQVLRDLSDIKANAKETARTHMQYVEAHEARIRALEDSRLQLQTQIKTSWWWVMLISGAASAGVNFLIRLLVK